MVDRRYDVPCIVACGPLVFMMMSFSTENWMPWVLIVFYAVTAFLFMPELNGASARQLLQWHIVRPMIASLGAISLFLSGGAEGSRELFALAIALVAAFMMGNMIAFIVAIVPDLLRHPPLRAAAHQKPATFAMAVFVLFLMAVTLLSLFGDQ